MPVPGRFFREVYIEVGIAALFLGWLAVMAWLLRGMIE